MKKLQSLLDTLIDPNLRKKVKESRLPNARKNKVLKILNKNEKELKQYTEELNNTFRKRRNIRNGLL
tara:strand:+ start:188 stop:388 length:201 start_codon:yes stop_codon:yes gene_type:complete